MVAKPLNARDSHEPHEPYAEAVSRLSGIRHALRLVDEWGGGPAGDPDSADDAALAAAFASADEASRRHFERESERTLGAASAGLESLLNQQQYERTPNVEASRYLVDQIRRELAAVSKIVLP